MSKHWKPARWINKAGAKTNSKNLAKAQVDKGEFFKKLIEYFSAAVHVGAAVHTLYDLFGHHFNL